MAADEDVEVSLLLNRDFCSSSPPALYLTAFYYSLLGLFCVKLLESKDPNFSKGGGPHR